MAPTAPPASFAHQGQPGWHQFRRSEFELRSHPQELIENAFDLAHFPTVHHTDAPEIVAQEQSGSTLTIRLTTRSRAGSYELPIGGQVNITAYELGHIIVNVRVERMGDIHILQYATPIEDDRMHVRHAYWGDIGQGLGRPLRWALTSMLRLEALRQARTDRPIWNNKFYRQVPALCAEDRLIGTFRKWAKGFYSRPATLSVVEGSGPAA